MFTTYSASAGSGKTTNLVADFIAICFRSDSRRVNKVDRENHLDIFQKILAITFTNNAAGEMKERIVSTLTTFAFESKENIEGSAKAIYDMVVKKLFGENPPDEQTLAIFMQLESKELLRRIIYDYARFTISTIDSFFQRVIRSSALSLQLNINYSVQIDMDEFYIQAIDQLLNELSADSILAKRIIALLNNSMEDTGNLNIDKELRKSLEILYANAEKNYEFLKILHKSDADNILERNKEVRKMLKEKPAQLSKSIEAIAQEGDLWMKHLEGINFHFPSFSKWFDAIVEDPIGNYRDSIDEFKNKDGRYFKKSKFTADEEKRIQEAIPHIEDCFMRIRDILHPSIKPYLDARICIKNADKLTLLNDLQSKMEEIKQQNNFFILSEANTLIFETIQNQGFESIFDRIRFDNYFIDEFQDTSKMQWDDLKPVIINNALANGKDVSLFGDVKQAIYRFRNGDADLFYNLINLERLQQDPDLYMVQNDNYQQITLQNNYRSLHSVVAFNNEFFDYYSKERELDKYYKEGLIQNIFKKDPGLVQVYIGSSDEEKENRRRRFQPEQDFEERILADESISAADAQILFAIKDAFMRGYNAGDIAVLYSGNDKCSRMANLILQQGWNVITEKALTLDSSAEVNLIIYTLQYLMQPNDILSQATILYYMSKITGKEDSLEEILFSLKQKENFNEFMNQQLGRSIPRDKWLGQPFLVLIKEIIHFYGMEAHPNSFVVSFENLVIQYLSTQIGDIPHFLSWWQQINDTKRKPSVTLPGKQNAITVCTIHKSKGLEYPVVILPYTSSGNQTRPFWVETDDGEVAYIELSAENSKGSSFEKSYEEEKKSSEMDDLNLLYVAHTRARDVLYVITQKSKREGTKYGDYLHKFISMNEEKTHLNGGLKFLKDEDDERFHYAGDPDWKKVKKEDDQDVDLKKITPTFRTSTFSLDNINVMDSEMIPEDDPRKEGTFIHDFLSKTTIFPTNQGEIESIIANVEESRKERLRKAFQTILEDSSLQPYFEPGIDARNEITILDEVGEQHRPDRIVFLPNQVMVIDYKTGKPHPQYEQQLETYCSLLRAMGYANVEHRILYV